MRHAGEDRPRAGVFQADEAQRHPHQQRQQHVGDEQHEHVVLDRRVDVFEDVHRDLFLRQRRPRQLDELALERVAGEQQEEHEEHDHRGLRNETRQADGTGQQPVHDAEIAPARRLRGGRRRRAPRHDGTARGAGGRLLDLGRGGLHLLDRRRAVGRIRQHARDLVRQGRQFVDDVQDLALHAVHGKRHADQDQAGNECGADGALDVPAFEPAHDGAQGVGDEDAEQQRHEEILGPLQAEYERDGRDHAEREAARIHMDGQAQVAVHGAQLFPGRRPGVIDEAGAARRLFRVRGPAGRNDGIEGFGGSGAGLSELHCACLKKTAAPGHPARRRSRPPAGRRPAGLGHRHHAGRPDGFILRGCRS